MRSALSYLLVLCYVASAFGQTCRTGQCIDTAGGSCTRTATAEYNCSPPLFENKTATECTCSNPPARGSVCSPMEENTEIAGVRCLKLEGVTPDQWAWHNRNGYLGESCNSNTDCYPPRVCLSGVCATTAKAGDACQSPYRVCPLGSACKKQTADSTSFVCKTNVEASGKCSTLAHEPACNNKHACLVKAAGETNGTCTPYRTVPAGTYAGLLSLCITGQIDANGVCSAVPPEKISWANAGKPCNTSDDCRVDPADLSMECVCTDFKGENKRVCWDDKIWKGWQATSADWNVNIANEKKCEKTDEWKMVPGTCSYKTIGAKVAEEIYCAMVLTDATGNDYTDCDPANIARVKKCKEIVDPNGRASISLSYSSLTDYGTTEAEQKKWKSRLILTLGVIFNVPMDRFSIVSVTSTGNPNVVVAIAPGMGPSSANVATALKMQAKDAKSILRNAPMGLNIQGASDKLSGAATVVVMPMFTVLLAIVTLFLTKQQ